MTVQKIGYTNTGVFTNKIYTITSFPNISLQNQEERYSISSYYETIYFDFPVSLAPFSKISVYGTQYRQSMFVNSSQNLEIINSPFPWLENFSRFRITLTKTIINLYPQSGALSVALVLGNRNFLNKDFLEYIRFSGLAHLLALSGLHLVIFISFFLWIFSLLGVPNRMLGIVTLPFSIIYLLLGGVGISLQRALLFHLLAAFFTFIRMPIKSSKILILALIINFVLLPKNIYALSFWLSYISVAGIVFCYGFCYNVLRKYFGKIIGAYLAVSVSAFLFVSPLLIFFFGVLNVYSIIASTIVVPFMPIILIFSFIAVFFSMFGIGISLLDTMIFVFYRGLFETTKIFSELPYGVLFIENRLLFVVIFISIFISLLLIIKKKRSYDSME